VGLFSVLVTSVTVNLFMERQFQRYVMARQQARNVELADHLGEQTAPNGKWDLDVIRGLGVQALDEGVLLRITEANGSTVWDALEYDSGLCSLMQENITHRMLTRYPGMNGGYTLAQYPIRSGDAAVGVLTVSFFGPFAYTENELFFIDTINRTLGWAAAGSLALSLLLAWAMSRGVVTPLVQLSGVARRIAGGEHGVELHVRSATREVEDLADSVNHLSRTLTEQESLRRRLTADVAHELRTPLATLQSHIEAMIDGIWQPTQERLTGCHEELRRLTRLVADLQTLARYEAQELGLSRSPVDLAEIAERCVELYRADFERKGVRLDRAGSSAVAPIDADKIRQVCLNLLSNALKHTPAGGSVRMETRATPAGPVILVADTGIGIPEADLPRVFERFYRVDGSRTRDTGGSGIGLTIAREIVRAHGGTITAASAPGAGSTFTVTFPA